MEKLSIYVGNGGECVQNTPKNSLTWRSYLLSSNIQWYYADYMYLFYHSSHIHQKRLCMEYNDSGTPFHLAKYLNMYKMCKVCQYMLFIYSFKSIIEAGSNISLKDSELFFCQIRSYLRLPQSAPPPPYTKFSLRFNEVTWWNWDLENLYVQKQ